ncbi:hypothetical protein WJX73_009275 [Symbiochloris irregularis]|uniref:CBS domain-containing protein n=1 Tax=Symbiochloris irregularis TaxID=706552 RepID=A0AAW1NSI4_9CHLO
MALRASFSSARILLTTPACSTLLQQSQQITTSTSAAAAEVEELRETNKVGKGGWGQTKVHDVLHSKKDNHGAWLWCAKDDFVIDAVRKMTKGNVGSLLVFDPSKIDLAPQEASTMKSAHEDAVVGIVTERDYLTKIVVMGKSSSDTKVSDVMTPQSRLMTVPPSDSVIKVMELMMKHGFRHVPVVDAGVYLGMVSIRDTVQVMVEEHKDEVGRLTEYIQGNY